MDNKPANTNRTVDPELEPALRVFPEITFRKDNLERLREMMNRETREMLSSLPEPEGVSFRGLEVPGPAGQPDVRIRICEPEEPDAPLPGLLWIHGGGYVSGIPEQADLRLAALAREIGCVAVSVAYRLAPEHPFPAPLEDCYVALKWMFDQSEVLGIDRKRIAIGGGSAGGGLAAGLGLLARDREELKVCYQLLLYPMLDDRNTAQASDALPDTLFWTRHNNHFGWKAYLGEEPGKDGVSVYAAPARAVDLAGLPPTFIAVGDIDLLAEEDILFAQSLLQSGVPVELHVYPGAFHAFDVKVPEAEGSKSCNTSVLQALKKALS